MLRLSLFNFLIILCVCLALGLSSRAQEVILSGKIVDQLTNSSIAFCNIIINSENRGTFSNEDGEFIVKVNQLPVTLMISNIAYQKRFIEVFDVGYLNISLTPAAKVLDEIVIKDRKYDKYAVDLVRRAWNKINTSIGKPYYGKAFYRQKSQNDDVYVELMEIFYDVKFNRNGIQDWEVQEGRYAEQKEELLNRNFTLMSRIFPTIQPRTNDLYLPFIENADDIYDIYLDDVLEVDDKRIAVVSMNYKPHIKRPAFEGEVYIDIKSFDVMKIKGRIKNDLLPIIKLTDKDGRFENLDIQYETAFKKDSNDVLLLDYVKFDQQFEYYIGETFRYPVHSQSFLTFYEYYKPLRKNKKLGGRLKKKNSDRNILDLVGYNSRFWEDNPIVKRTPIEEEVINSFEKSKAFGTIFLNSLEQIALNENDIGNEPFLQDLLVKVKSFSNSNPHEKVYLHFDKQSYLSGEPIWYAAYVVENNGLFLSNISIVLHLDLIGPDGKVIDFQKIKLSRGKGTGQLKLNNDLPTGRYLIRGYTNWMRNQERDFYFNQSVDIYNPKDVLSKEGTVEKEKEEKKIDLQFFPEGGHLVAGLASQVGFKAINQNGKGVEVEGIIVDEMQYTVAFLKASHNGMGSFFFKPLDGVKYKALLKDPKVSFDVPEVLNSGYVMYAKNSHSKSIKIRIQASTDLQGEPVFLVGQSQGNIYFRQKKFFKNGIIDVEVPKNKLPQGIIVLTLFDVNQKPRAERILFINQESEFSVNLRLKIDKDNEGDKAKLKIATKDEEGRPLVTNLSLAVTDADQAFRDKNENHILTHLLLESELKGFIESPGYYFNEPNKAKAYALDLVMMTHGWRKFPWLEILKHGNVPIYWPPQKGIGLKGVVKDPATEKPLINQDVMLVSTNVNSNFAYMAKTNNLGIFEMEGMSFTANDNLIFKVLGDKGKVLPAKVSWEIPKRPRVKFRGHPIAVDKEIRKKISDAYLRQRLQDTLVIDQLLDEVIVEGSIINDGNNFETNAHMIDSRKTGTSYSDIFQMISSNAPGVLVTGSGTSSNLTVDGSGTPLFIIDGVEVNTVDSQPPILANNNAAGGQNVNGALGQPEGGSNTSTRASNANNSGGVADILGTIHPNDVNRIEVLKGFKAAAYGIKGGNGVIIIHTNRTNTGNKRINLPDKNVLYIKEKGFETVKTFYQPKFEYEGNKKSFKHNPTIFWLPSITTNRNGEANILFSIPKKTAIQLVVEGISNDGKPGVHFETIKNQ